MTDTAQAGLHGPVRMCGIELDYVYPDHHWVLRTDSKFSERGSLVEQRHRNPDGSGSSILCLYDDAGRILQKKYRPEGSTGKELWPEQVFFHRYDALGRPDRVVARTGHGTERVCESYAYDAAGRKTLTVYPDPVLRGRAAVTAEEALEMSTEASSIVTIFDGDGRPVNRIFYDPNEMVERRVLLRYDAAGRLVEEGERELDGRIREDFRNLYRYSARGQLLEKVMHHYFLGTHWKAFAYNGQGDAIEEKHQRTAGIVHEGEEEWTYHYRYQYDGHDNWVERVTETTIGTGEARVSMVERRRIDYW